MMKWLKSATKFHAEEKIMMVTYRTHHEVRTDQGLYDSVYHKGAKSERPRKGGEREREGGWMEIRESNDGFPSLRDA